MKETTENLEKKLHNNSDENYIHNLMKLNDEKDIQDILD